MILKARKFSQFMFIFITISNIFKMDINGPSGKLLGLYEMQVRWLGKTPWFTKII